MKRITLIALLMLGAVFAAHAMAAPQTVVSCPFNTGSGDGLDRGFYITNYAATNIDQVTLEYGASTAGSYMITLTARNGAYDGPIIGAKTASVSLSSSFALTPVTFSFGGAPVAPGSTVTFSQTQTGPGAGFFNNGSGPCPGVTETNGTTPPLDSFRNARTGVTITALSPPGITSVAPSSGSTSGGTAVVITGHDFTGATAVRFGGVPATSLMVNSDTSVTTVAPPGAAGSVDVTVTGPGGQSPASVADHFTYVAPPRVTSVSPVKGPRTGGTSVAITGQNFTGATAVSFGGVRATRFRVNSDTSITAVAPAAAVGSIDVTVTTLFGRSATSATDRFTFTQVCVVPKLKGKTLKAATKALKRAHCGLGKLSGPTTGNVKRQSRKRGTNLPAGTKVNITLV